MLHATTHTLLLMGTALVGLAGSSTMLTEKKHPKGVVLRGHEDPLLVNLYGERYHSRHGS